MPGKELLICLWYRMIANRFPADPGHMLHSLKIVFLALVVLFPLGCHALSPPGRFGHGTPELSGCSWGSDRAQGKLPGCTAWSGGAEDDKG